MLERLLMDALNLKCKSRQNARQLRLRPGTERIYRLLWRNPELTAKQVFVAMDSTYKRIRAHRKAKGRPIRANELTLNWPGFPSRVSRLKNRLRADKAAMALAVAEYGAEE